MPKRSTTQRCDDVEILSMRQDAVVSRRQLAAFGFDSDAVGWRIAARAWQPLGRCVILHGGPITDRERQWAAVLSVRPPAALTGITAARRYGLRGFDSGSVHVVFPAGRRPIPIAKVSWHQSGRFGPADVVRGGGPPAVRPARAVIDAAAWTPAARTACATMVAAVQQRVVTAGALRFELAAAGHIAHATLLRAILSDIEGGADSLSEIDFATLARRAGLPPPIRQSFRLDTDGRRRYLDADFDTFSVEVDGGFHRRASNAWDDARRQNALVIGGDRILRFPSVVVRTDPDAVIAQLRLAMATFGVRPRDS